MNILFSFNWILIAAVWFLGNGILHDMFVIINHKGGYDRELLRLLMDGHLLILSGLIFLVGYFLFRTTVFYGAILSLIVATSSIVYCLMIFPFLKSFATIAISLMVIVVCLRALQVSNGIL